MATKRQKNAATQIGSAAGLVGGAALGYKGVKGTTRARRGAKWARHAYKTSRKEFGNGRLSSASLAARTAPDAMKGPKSLPTLGSVGAGYVGAVGGSLAGSAGASQLADKHTRKVAKRDKPLMSETEQRRRQKLQGKIGRTTSTLGLTGVGLAGAGAIAAKKPGMLKNIPKLKNANPEKLKNAAFNTGIISGGIGGVGGFNQASIYSAEARRRKTPVAKGQTMDMGYFGEEGTPLATSEIEKAWEPLASKFDAESRRHQRNHNTQAGLTVASAGTGAGAGVAGRQALKQVSANRNVSTRARNLPNVRAGMQARKLKAVKSGKVAAGLAGGSAALAGGAALVHRQRKGSWQSYGKRWDEQMISAFGVDHGEFSKADRTPEQDKAFHANRKRTAAVAGTAAGAYGVTGGRFAHSAHQIRSGTKGRQAARKAGDVAGYMRSSEKLVRGNTKIRGRGALFAGTALAGAGAMGATGVANERRFARASKT